MSFIRAFDEKRCYKVKESKMWERLLPEIQSGIIYPAIRDEMIYFYYEGGVLFLFEGDSFKYNTDYFKYVYGENDYPSHVSKGTYTLDRIEGEIGNIGYFFDKSNYEKLKEGIVKKYQSSEKTKSKKDCCNERKYLNGLYSQTYGISGEKESKVIVLDIEIRFNDNSDKTENDKKKCDMILYHMGLNELMLVEAKLSGNPEVKSRTENVKVFQQMRNYNSWIKTIKQREVFETQYKNYITIVSENLNLLPYTIDKDRLSTLIIRENVKLLIAEGDNYFYKNHLPKIYDHLGKENVCYFDKNESREITPEEIWYRSV